MRITSLGYNPVNKQTNEQQNPAFKGTLVGILEDIEKCPHFGSKVREMSFDIMVRARSIADCCLEPFGTKGRKVSMIFDEAGDEYVGGLVKHYETTPAEQTEGLTWSFTPSPKKSENPLLLG